jgi:hypothetical protein
MISILASGPCITQRKEVIFERWLDFTLKELFIGKLMSKHGPTQSPFYFRVQVTKIAAQDFGVGADYNCLV